MQLMKGLASLLEVAGLAVDLDQDFWLGHQLFENPLIPYRALAVRHCSELNFVVVVDHVRASDRLKAS